MRLDNYLGNKLYLIIRNGLSGYADTYYEYVHTEEASTEGQKAEFERKMCRKYSHIRRTHVFVKQIIEEQQIPHSARIKL